MNATLLLNLAGLLLAGAILIYAEPSLARMGKATHWAIRYAMLLLAGGALGVVLTIANGGTIDLATLLVLAGIALFMLFERRLRTAFPNRQRGHHA